MDPTLLPAFFKPNPEQLELHLTNPNLNWDSILQQASAQAILPALANQIRQLNLQTQLPTEIGSLLTIAESLNAERNQHILNEAAYAATLLNQIEIQPVALKGLAYLLTRTYPNQAARYLEDIDFLIPATDIPRAVLHLKKNSYFENENLSFPQFHHHHAALRRPGCAHIEIHRRVGIGPADRLLPAAVILANATPFTYKRGTEVSGIDVHVCRLASRPSPSNIATFLIPTPTDLAHHLILHSQLAHPYRERIAPPLRSLLDLQQLQSRFPDEIDWQALATVYKNNGQLPTLILHLHQAHEVLGLPIPPPIPTKLPFSLRLRYQRRTILNHHPRLKFADPTYLYMSLLSRRLQKLPDILTHPSSWPQAISALRRLNWPI